VTPAGRIVKVIWTQDIRNEKYTLPLTVNEETEVECSVEVTTDDPFVVPRKFSFWRLHLSSPKLCSSFVGILDTDLLRDANFALKKIASCPERYKI
jgi:hypothetical protein